MEGNFKPAFTQILIRLLNKKVKATPANCICRDAFGLTDNCHVGKLHKSVIARCYGDLAQIGSRLLHLYVLQ